ncbi:MAG: tripartite tricarboxylate transporter substrate binding protein [Rubrivivax sp.]|nr:tripartite tricarboxylate transporter substrate binding protein [Rubrivivax sp.]MBK7261184.1 tripartite tricarboxylate transporter substrate binding protein [Rubrivivax sp.]MBK8529747.1 tripartite tricarboxylate transporter substrate binding protein [Rubrivivax sp.]
MRLWLATLLLGVSSLAWAQDKFPQRNVEVILPYAAGGGVDAMGRAFAREAARITGQSWVVVNRDGGAGVIGFSALTRAPADGHTLVFSPASPLTNAPFLTKTMPFRNDQVEPVCQVFENVFSIAVRPDSPIQSMQDLVARAKAAPGKLSYGHAGPGSVPHMGVAAVAKALGLQLNGIPYRGDGAMLPQLMGGQLDFGAPALSSIGGKGLRVLAVLADKRHPAAPDVPSLTELGYPAVTPGLNGVYAPAGTPRATLDQLQTLCQQVLASDGFKQAAKTLQQTPVFLNAAQFKARIDSTYRTHAELVPDLGLEKN